MAYADILADVRQERVFRQRRDPLREFTNREVIARYRLDVESIDGLTRRFSVSPFANRSRRSNALSPEMQVNYRKYPYFSVYFPHLHFYLLQVTVIWFVVMGTNERWHRRNASQSYSLNCPVQPPEEKTLIIHR